MCKVTPEPKIQVVTFGVVDRGLRFLAVDAEGVQADKTITLRRDERDELFNLVLGWSGVRWRAVRVKRSSSETAEGKDSRLERVL